MLKFQLIQLNKIHSSSRYITIPKIMILGIVGEHENGLCQEPSSCNYTISPFYQVVAISICLGFLFANPPVSHTIPIPSEVCTSEPLGLRFRLAATMT